MWSLMGCAALVRIRPQHIVAGQTDKPEMTRRQCHVTSVKPAVDDGQRDKSAMNGAAGDSKKVADVNVQPCNQGSREADDHLATCSSHNQAPDAQMQPETSTGTNITATNLTTENTDPHDGPSTIARGILLTSKFIWLPPCQPHQSRSNSEVVDAYLSAAMECPRWHIRRNALCDYMRVLLPQKTRERLEKDVAERKSSLTRKVSQYFKSLYSNDYEVDLV